MTGLTTQEVYKIVNRYIGVEGGYLVGFTYRTHAEFYPEYCDLDIDPGRSPGTTRERFIKILESVPLEAQAKIVRGVLKRFPVDSQPAPLTRTKELHDELLGVALRLEGESPIAGNEPQITSDVVSRAIRDAESLLRANGPVSAIDRVHTALHGWLREACKRANVEYSSEDSMTKLLKGLRGKHPALRSLGTPTTDVGRVLQAMATIMDALNPIRNDGSLAHPNDKLLDKEEALLVVNVARTLLQYLDAKLTQSPY